MMGNKESPDIESSTDDYASRFSGPVGQWFLEVQSRCVRSLLDKDLPQTALDVGGGHGQLVELFLDCKSAVTILGSEPICQNRICNHINHTTCSFVVGDILSLPFADRSFDTVASIRMAAHITDTERFISELCRVSRDRVILDYPSWRSFNIFSKPLFFFKKKVEKNTRPFRIFWDSQINNLFNANGFKLYKSCPQFLVPMAVHRALKHRGISCATEWLFHQVGLTGMFGSPTLVCFRRIS